MNSFRPHSKTLSGQIQGQITLKNESNERMSGGRRTPQIEAKMDQTTSPIERVVDLQKALVGNRIILEGLGLIAIKNAPVWLAYWGQRSPKIDIKRGLMGHCLILRPQTSSLLHFINSSANENAAYCGKWTGWKVVRKVQDQQNLAQSAKIA